MALSLVLLPTGAFVLLACFWWRAHRRQVRARQAQMNARIQLHLDGIRARQRLVRYQAWAHEAIEDEIRQARRELQPWRYPYA